MAELSRRHYGRLGLAAVAASLIVALLAFAPATNAAEEPESRDAGVILLSTGPNDGDNWVRYYADPAASADDAGNLMINAYTAHQEIDVTRRCLVDTDNSILDLSQSPAGFGLGLVDSGFGTRERNNCSTGNGQIESGHTVTISLGDYFKSPQGSEGQYVYGIDRAEIDIEGKQNAKLRYQLDDGSFRTLSLNPSSDNGPDAGLSDNVIKVIEPDSGTTNFASITVSPGPLSNSRALVSVEGGGDAGGSPYPCPGGESCDRDDLGVTQTLFSVVKLFDGVLGCDPDNNTATAGGANQGGPALDASLERNENWKLSTCTLIPYVFQIEQESVYFDYFDQDEQGAQFVVQIAWDPSDVPVDPINPPVREIDYSGIGEEDDYVPGVACASVTNGVYDHIVDGVDVPWCLIEQQLVLTNAGWQQIQWWHGKGDPRWR
jgi:hypothetical protein